MKLGRIIGRVVSTHRDPALSDHRLLLVQPVDGMGQSTGSAQVMLDAAGAGSDELVLYVTGREAATCLRDPLTPADASITAIVDHYDVDGNFRPGVTKIR